MKSDVWRDRWALVTGASAGIGGELAQELAARGAHLVITARRSARLEELARALRERHGVRVEVVPADLADPRAPEALIAFTEERGIAVELLVNNAGFGAYGEFRRADPARLSEMVQVNCAAVVRLTRLFLPAMIERRRGAILIVASTASFQPVPYSGVYAATKAFDRIFAESLAEEVRRHGVRVCALCPGPTATEFGAVAGSPMTQMRVGRGVARDVARAGLSALERGKPSVVTGWANEVALQTQRLAPRRWVARLVERVFRPGDLG